jgi:xanthine/CO dehydrogenase XdhC/CoxF family maturation factor
MTHELRDLVEQAMIWQHQGMKVVLATVVALEGSSYRRPGVRMLINDQDGMRGAVSGGCVEKEVHRQARSVLADEQPKMITYDGRFRLGCEGMLYILIEPIFLTEECYSGIQNTVRKRIPFNCEVAYNKELTETSNMGTVFHLPEGSHSLHPSYSQDQKKSVDIYSQTFPPVFQLYIFGAEHDSVQLSRMAAQLGWDVHIVAPPDEGKALAYFQGAKSLTTPLLNEIDTTGIDQNTAVILMSHSFHKDLQYLMALREVKAAYIGLLGPRHRRERLYSEFLNTHPDTPHEFFEGIHGPAGIDIGAESGEEIALSILAEILSVRREVELQPLKFKSGNIHE